MFCTKCGKQSPDTAKFCSNCGQPLVKQKREKICPNCQKVREPDMLFCDNCGTRLISNIDSIISESGEKTVAASKLIMSLEGLSLYKGKQPIGTLKVYSDKVEFVHSGRNFTSPFLSKQTDVVDTFTMKEIAIATKSKHPKISSYVEIILKNGNKMKYLDRAGQYRAEEMFAFVDAINANL